MPYSGTITLKHKDALPKTVTVANANDLQELCDRIQEEIDLETFEGYEVGSYENLPPSENEYGDITANSGQIALHKRYPLIHQFVAVSKAHLYYAKL